MGNIQRRKVELNILLRELINPIFNGIRHEIYVLLYTTKKIQIYSKTIVLRQDVTVQWINVEKYHSLETLINLRITIKKMRVIKLRQFNKILTKVKQMFS